MFAIKDTILKFQKQLLIFFMVISLILNAFLIFKMTSNKSVSANNSSVENDISEELETYSLPYQNLYPELYAEELSFEFVNKENRTVYLTFDDGPSKITPQVLDILKEADVKATFFIVYSDTEFGKSMYKRIVDEGHAIGVHTSSHAYKEIYNSVESYLEDFEKTHRQIQEVTGVNTRLFRFPGGSINAYNKSNYQAIIAEMTRRGFIYYDWSVDSKDTSNKPTADTIVDAVISGISGKHSSVVLLHDAGNKTYTVEALPQFIKIIKNSVYDFAPLDTSIPPPQFGYAE